MSNQSDNFSYVKPNGKRALRAWVLGDPGYCVGGCGDRWLQHLCRPRAPGGDHSHPAACSDSGSYFNTNAYAGSDSYPNCGCKRDQLRFGGGSAQAIQRSGLLRLWQVASIMTALIRPASTMDWIS